MASKKELERLAKEEEERKAAEEKERLVQEILLSRKRKKRLLIFAAVFLCILSGVGTFFLFGGKSKVKVSMLTKEESFIAGFSIRPVLDLDAPLLGDRTVHVSLSASGKCDFTKIPGFSARSKDAVIMLFSDMSAQQCLYDGDLIRAEIAGRLNNIVPGCVDKVYFNDFLVK